MMATEPVDMPFHIVGTLDGVFNFHSGYRTEDEARASCEARNKEKERLGLRVRYDVVVGSYQVPS